MFCKKCGNEIKEGFNFCTRCGNGVQNQQLGKSKSFFAKKKLIFSAISMVVILSVIIIFLYAKNPSTEQINQRIAGSVVNIYCEGASEEDVSGGSGTIFSEDGLVLTNAHIIPSDYREGETNCVVILPDPIDGSPKEMYLAYPIIIPNLSEQYDIALMQIHDVFHDQEEGVAYGEYPKKFPAYAAGQKCSGEDIKLGEPIRIYGYPAISGGYALTITEGVVSSLLLEEGYIITSAKISNGNSGGLAIDKNGCMVGIPSMVNSDENESLGVIISRDTISEFSFALQAIGNE